MIHKQINIRLWQVETGGTRSEHHDYCLGIVFFHYSFHFLNKYFSLVFLLIGLFYPSDEVEYLIVHERVDVLVL